MHVDILDPACLVPGVVTQGYVLQLGRDEYTVLFLCHNAQWADVIRFQQRFLRQSNWFIREQPMSIDTYNEIMRVRHGDEVSDHAAIIKHNRRKLK